MIRRLLKLNIHTISLAIGVAMVLVGCSDKDAMEAQAAGAAAAATGNPLLVGIGTLVSIVAGHFVSRANIASNDMKEWNDDEIAAMVRGLEKHGYVMTKPAIGLITSPTK